MFSLLSRRIRMAGGGLLPAEYQQVEYLQGNGSAYIDLGVNNKTTFGCRADVQLLSPHMGDATFSAGAYSGNTAGIGVRIDYFGINCTPYPRGEWTIPNTRFPEGEKYERRAVQSNYKGSGYALVEGLDNTRLAIPSGAYSDTQHSFRLFAASTYDGSLYGNGYSVLFHFELTDGPEVVMDLYPCYRKSDGKPGIYDILTDTFHTNANPEGDDFTVGPNI